jgi:hypothetical protein
MSLVGRIVAGESATPAGQQAVLNVMQNRAAVNFGGYGTTIEAQATAPLQFSAYPNALGASSSTTEGMVSAAQGGTLGNIVPNSLNYANPSIMNPATTPNSWVWGAQASGQGVQIGGNTFWANSKGGSPGYDPSQLASANGVPAGPPDNATGGNTGYSVTANPSGTSSTTSTGTGTTPAQGTQIQTALQPEETSFISSTVTGIENAMGAGVKGVVTAAENAVGTYLGGLQNWFSRAALILLGVILIGIALVFIMWDHGGKQTVETVARAA